MIELLFGVTLVASAVALAMSVATYAAMQALQSEQMYTLDAADELFEDHEERITDLELAAHSHATGLQEVQSG